MIGLAYAEEHTTIMLSRFDTTPERDRQTDGQTGRRTELLHEYRASAWLCWRAIKTALCSTVFCFDALPARDGQRDRRTDVQTCRPMAKLRSSIGETRQKLKFPSQVGPLGCIDIRFCSPLSDTGLHLKGLCASRSVLVYSRATFRWYSLRIPMEGWLGRVDLGGWRLPVRLLTGPARRATMLIEITMQTASWSVDSLKSYRPAFLRCLYWPASYDVDITQMTNDS